MNEYNHLPTLGRIEPVDILEIWQHEALQFTPWLAQPENLALLGEAVGMELEFEAMEKYVGPFRADILCKNILTDEWILIENQLYKTDHNHLGQIITYAAGLQATTIIWIAREFTEEHRAALDWLNENTIKKISFFGVKVELWRIGNSSPAPRLHIISGPNDWKKEVESGKESTENQTFRSRYWATFTEMVFANPGSLKTPAPSKRNWVIFTLGKSGFHLAASINPTNRYIRVEVYLSGLYAKSHFHQLLLQKEYLEKQLGLLEWQELPGKQASRILAKLINTDPANENDWKNQHVWLLEMTKRFYEIFPPIIKRLNDGIEMENMVEIDHNQSNDDDSELEIVTETY